MAASTTAELVNQEGDTPPPENPPPENPNPCAQCGVSVNLGF